jgi:hypothetical protein
MAPKAIVMDEEACRAEFLVDEAGQKTRKALKRHVEKKRWENVVLADTGTI